MLHYSLHENLLTDRPDDFAAQTHVSATYNREQFIDLMLQRGSTVTRSDILAVLNSMEETGAYIVENGGEFTLPLVQTGFRMPGVFHGATDVFDPLRHELHVTTRPGTLLREVEKRVKPVKISPPAPRLQILEVRDSVTGEVDGVLTPGGVAEIAGVEIKLDGDKPDVGLYFVNLAGGADTRADTVAVNKPSQLVVLIPKLTSGIYQVKVTTQYSHGTLRKESRSTVFAKHLTVS
ncbi:MAG: DUF4469 domain-containing protein [Tannerella sp.]|jgi:hypothetical protein|nr:DUF4469 domain-containing protein [Tannerella sp.]